MFTQRSRHKLFQALFWNSLVARVVPLFIRYERMFDVVVRNYSLIGSTNGERWLLTLLDSEPTVFDVGFHDGDSTNEILKARSSARVVAFDPSNFAQQSYQTRFATDGRVSFHKLALAEQAGELEFHDYQNMSNSLAPRRDMPNVSSVKYKVPITTIDVFCRRNGIDHINFLKIDAEGYDLHVLEGSRQFLAGQGVDIFVFEFASGWASSKRYLWEVDEYFKQLPYKLYRLFNGFLCPFVYDFRIDSCCTLSCMYVGISEKRLARDDIRFRNFKF